MEAVGLVASIAQLVALAAQITKLSYGYMADVRNASRTQKGYLQEISALMDVLFRLEDALIESKTLSTSTGHPDSLPAVTVSECHQSLALQRAKLDKHTHRLIWPFKEKETRHAIEDLHRFRELFADYTVASISRVSSSTFRNTEVLKQENERNQLLDWLSPIDGESKTQPTPVAETGSWFINHPQFQKWFEGSPSVLWCYGPPGVGKSSLASSAIRHISEKSNSDGACVVYYFCDFAARRQQTDLAILRSILRQIVSNGSEQVLTVLSKQRRACPSMPKADELLKALEGVCSTHKIFLVFDAPDELETPKKIVSRLRKLGQARCRILVTSRDHPDIRREFSYYEHMEIKTDSEDMVVYIKHRFSDSDLYDMITKNESIIEAVSEKANGLFLLAELILDQLLELPTIKQMRKALKSMPTKLEEAYTTTVKRIDAQPKELRDMARRLIGWIVHSARPLRPDEVIHAFAVEPGDEEIDPENFVMIQTLLRACAGLVSMDRHRMTLGLVHATAYEFFQDEDRMAPAREDMARTALTYLCLMQLRDGPCVTVENMIKRSEDMPFLDYAARFWGRHASDPALEQRLDDLTAELLEHPGLRASAFQALQYRPEIKDQDLSKAVFESLPHGQSTLHVAAYWGLHHRVRTLLTSGENANAIDSQQWTPLHWAASCGHTETMKLLLEGGAKINARDSHQWTPLFWASFRGNIGALRLLLDHNVDHLLADVHGWTALHWAVAGGETELIDVLLQHHAAVMQRISSQSADSKCAPAPSSRYGQGSEFTQTLNHRTSSSEEAADRATQDTDGSRMTSAIEGLAATQNVDLFDILLKERESGEKRAGSLWSSGHFDPPMSNMWRVLNKAQRIRGVHYYLTEQSGRVLHNDTFWVTRMLHQAIKAEKIPFMRLLIELGADINGKLTQTALHAAAFRHDAKYTKILLDHGADVSVRDANGYIALHQAVLNAFEDTTEALLAGGSDANAETAARGRDRPDGPRHLYKLSIGDARMASNLTSLMLACGYRRRTQDDYDLQVRIISSLLRNGANPSLQNKHGRTCLHYAPSSGNPEVVRTFIGQGVNVNVQDQHEMTALHHAAEFGNLEIFRLLVQSNAEVDVHNMDGASPLHLAAKFGHTEIVCELVKMGLDVNRADKENTTALHHAAKACDIDMVRILLDHGADIQCTDILGKSSIHHLAACKEEHRPHDYLQDVFDLLYDRSSPHLLNAEYDAQAKGDSSYGILTHTALSTTIENSNWRLFRILRDAGGTLPKEKSELLDLAIGSIQGEVVHHLLENGAILTKQDRYGQKTSLVSRLHGLGWKNFSASDLDILLRNLIAIGADINERTNAGETILNYSASRLDSAEVAEVFLTHGADPYCVYHGIDSILRAVIHGNSTFLRALLTHRPIPPPKGHWTVYLEEARDSSDTEELVRISNALHAWRQAGNSYEGVLLAAMKQRHYTFADLLATGGLDIEWKDSHGWNMLHYAVEHQRVSIVKLLLEAGADVDAATETWADQYHKPSGLNVGNPWRGRPLHIAALFGNEEIVRMLLSKGADVNASTNEDTSSSRIYGSLHGPTALRIALGTGTTYRIDAPNLGDCRLRIARMLIEKGANVEGVSEHLTKQDMEHFKGFEDVWDAVRSGRTGASTDAS